MKRPPIIIPDSVAVAEPTLYTLPNGARLYAHSNPGQAVCRISFVFTAGTSTQTHPFVASSTENLLCEGSLRHSATQIADSLDYYGSYYEVSLDRDYAVVTFCCLTRFFEQSIPLFEEILLEPAFDSHEIEIYAEKRKQSLSIERSKSTTRARELFAIKLYGEQHPYGISSPERQYDNLQRDDIVEFYRSRYTSRCCFAVCTTDTAPEHLSRLMEFVGKIPDRGSCPDVTIPSALSAGYCYEPFKNAVQSSIRIGKVLFGRTHPDFTGMQILSYVLGGYFGSRLIKNLRERNGFTYSIFASMINMRYSGYFAIATDVGSEVTSEAVAEILREIELLCTEPIPEEELETVRRIMFGEYMRILDGPMGIVDATIEATENGTDNSYITRSIAALKAVTPEQLRDLAAKYLDPQGLTTVVVGPDTNASR